jgi:GMP synthase-like glutamine amidotransferase
MSGSRPPRLWIIDPSIKNPEEQGAEFVLEDWPGESRILRPALRPGDGPTPKAGYDADGFVLLGSAASVHDGLDWLASLSDWLGPLLDGTVARPLLGICFGHQLIAHSAGGRVGFLHADRSKRLGVETTSLEHGSLLPGRHSLRVVVSHREEVQALPEGYRITARRPGVAVDGLEHDSLPVYSFQFHPEALDDFARRVGVPVEGLDERVLEDSRRVLGAFRRHVLRG